MSVPLRARYFRALAGLLAITYGSFVLILVLFNLHEWREHGAIRGEELEETLILLGLMMVSIPAVLWAAWRIAGSMLNPLRVVSAAAERIRAGNLSERISVFGEPRDELERLAATLNEAFDRYAGAVERLDQFSADASHQLRNPLAAVRATAEVCLQRARSEGEYREALGEMLEEVDRLQVMVDQLLELARLEPALLQRIERVDLRAALRDWMNEAAAPAEARGVRLEGPSPGAPLPVRAHPGLLREVHANLFNNALAATPVGGIIRCDAARLEDGRVAWWMEDSGPGIPEAERARVADRFYRGSTASARGAGLGLSIVQRIIDLHGGQLAVMRGEQLGGALIRMALPADGDSQ